VIKPAIVPPKKIVATAPPKVAKTTKKPVATQVSSDPPADPLPTILNDSGEESTNSPMAIPQVESQVAAVAAAPETSSPRGS